MILSSKQYKLLIVERNNEFHGVNLSEMDIMGRTSIEWVKKIDPDCEVVENVNVNELCNTVVLYSDMPLVNLEILEQISINMEELGINNAELPCGWIIGKKGENFSKIDGFNDVCCRVKDSKTYAYVNRIIRERINDRLMSEGVFMTAPETVYVDDTVIVKEGTIINNNNVLKGATVIGSKVVLGINNELTDTEIGDNTKLVGVVANQAKVGANTTVGPYAYLRPGAVVGDNCKVGDFVEIKNSNVLSGAKVPHLAYVGDADVGHKVNVGCGVIFANYDGKKKHRTKVGDNTFLGSNTTLIAPVEVGNNVFIAAGSTIAHSIQDGALVIARARETVKEGRAETYLKKE
ncbi:MAG: hypothetical protein IJF76_00305 [Clostridia bacterium]|nr:hypothetical protein [Clostridia bacterium]